VVRSKPPDESVTGVVSLIATVWQWLRAEIGDRRLQFRLCLRVTVAAIVALLLIASEKLPR